MGCAPTNRKRTTTPAAQARPSHSSIVDKPPETARKGAEERQNVTSIGNFEQAPSKNKESSTLVKSQTKLPKKGRPKVDPVNDDIIIKDERRGFIIQKMDFVRKEHLQG